MKSMWYVHRMILEGAYAGGGAYEDAYAKKKVQEASSVAVYGVGKFGKRFLDYLKNISWIKKFPVDRVKKSNTKKPCSQEFRSWS